MTRYIFKICVNITNEDDLIELLGQLDDHLCMRKLFPKDPIGICLGLIHLDFEGEKVILQIWAVSPDLDRPWIKYGGTLVDFAHEGFRDILANTAQGLITA